MLSVVQGFLDVPPFYFSDNVEKSIGMNIKVHLTEKEEVEGPISEFLLTEEEVLLKEEEVRGEEQSELCSKTGSSQTLDSDGRLLRVP